MVDTVKSLTTLQGLLADNTTGDIAAQDLRDFLVTALMQTNATTAVTTTDITGAIGQVYNLDLSGLTANRSLILPVASVGDTIQVNITNGDPDFGLIIKGAATVTINGGTAATEWSRLFITGESVTLRATSSTNWHVVNNGLYSYASVHGNTGAQQDLTPAAYTKVTAWNTPEFDIGGLWDAANSRLIPKRKGKYLISADIAVYTADQQKILTILYKNGTAHLLLGRGSVSTPSTDYGGFGGAAIIEVTADTDYFEIYVYSSGTGTYITSVDKYLYLSLEYLGE